jgi:hypothetical protein
MENKNILILGGLIAIGGIIYLSKKKRVQRRVLSTAPTTNQTTTAPTTNQATTITTTPNTSSNTTTSTPISTSKPTTSVNEDLGLGNYVGTGTGVRKEVSKGEYVGYGSYGNYYGYSPVGGALVGRRKLDVQEYGQYYGN